ncbi:MULTISPECIES: ATP-binding protein [unclassified Roseiflexus]|jgi:serine/threonine-protein kinase RsbW|uniref:ATP-binding protein n=1 Tax=unclassified Roseiflexus TaxID=2609473 RepID=UPI0000D7FC14|nr:MULTISPECIES: ATP-binding protein [unclassified Roseiflexus]ABQ88473.1 putative anti-sigma regulatory factor, serine/threonine protein kinase [Roseiflexus sp. RS-1]MBO9322895.1 ATP-binding protein [Roseiflexus sp.]MCL6541277.1 ATP-binding protein [Roseiflexus sp.]
MQQVLVNIPSVPIFERVVRASADEVGRALGFSAERVEDLKLAVSEAVNNAIDHGNKRQPGKLVEVVFALHNDKLEVHVTDEGGGIDTIDFSRKVVDEQNLDAGMHRGFGMYLISALVDDCEVNSSQSGTTLTLRLYRRNQDHDE